MRLLTIPDRCVLLMMGASGSGKSTLAVRLAHQLNAHIVSYDTHQRLTAGDDGTQSVTRAALHAAWAELDSRCRAGTPVIVDGTHSQPDRRAMVRAIAARHDLDTIIIALATPLSVCLQRQQQRGRRVPAADIIRQHTAVTRALPTLIDEGHAAVVLLSQMLTERTISAYTPD